MDTTGALACVDTAATCRSGLYAPGAGLRDRWSCRSQQVQQPCMIRKTPRQLHRLPLRAFGYQPKTVPLYTTPLPLTILHNGCQL
jgi:hypothetical protein